MSVRFITNCYACRKPVTFVWLVLYRTRLGKILRLSICQACISKFDSKSYQAACDARASIWKKENAFNQTLAIQYVTKKKKQTQEYYLARLLEGFKPLCQASEGIFQAGLRLLKRDCDSLCPSLFDILSERLLVERQTYQIAEASKAEQVDWHI